MIKSYLFNSAKNKILNHYRSVNVRKKYARDITIFEARFDNSNQDQLDLADLQNVIEKSLEDLPERCQIAFRLSRMENMAISDIAKQMGISHRTVENYISQALKHLRSKLDDSKKTDGGMYTFRIILFL